MIFSAKKALLPVACVLLLHASALAQSKAEAAVSTAVETLRQALLSGNQTELEQITVEGLSYGHSSGKVENRAQFIEALVSRQSDFTDIVLSNQTISVANKTAIVRHSLSAATNNAGKPGTVKLDVLLVFVKTKKGWKLLARQAVKKPE